MSDNNGRLFLREKDFVEVVDADGNDLPPVPKHWGEDQLPLGAKFKKKASRSTGSSSSSTPATGDSGDGSQSSGDGGPAEPAGSARTEAWVAFAKAKGATEEDLVDEDGNALGRDALRAKYGTSSDGSQQS